MPGTLLFGDDDSQSADVAWLWINNQSWPDWTVEVLTAFAPSPDSPTDEEEWQPPRPRTMLDGASSTRVAYRRAFADPRIALARRGSAVRRAVVCADGSDHALAAAKALAGMPWLGDTEIPCAFRGRARVPPS